MAAKAPGDVTNSQSSKSDPETESSRLSVAEQQVTQKVIRVTRLKGFSMTVQSNGETTVQVSPIEVASSDPKDIVRLLRDLQQACQVVISKLA